MTTNQVWMFTQRNYSTNNRFGATTYNGRSFQYNSIDINKVLLNNSTFIDIDKIRRRRNK
jgi:hypothetical protein